MDKIRWNRIWPNDSSPTQTPKGQPHRRRRRFEYEANAARELPVARPKLLSTAPTTRNGKATTNSTDQAIFLVKVMRASCAQSYFVSPTICSPFLNTDQPEKVLLEPGFMGRFGTEFISTPLRSVVCDRTNLSSVVTECPEWFDSTSCRARDGGVGQADDAGRWKVRNAWGVVSCANSATHQTRDCMTKPAVRSRVLQL